MNAFSDGCRVSLNRFARSVALGVVSSLLSAGVCAGRQVAWSFQAGADGWAVSDFSCGSYGAPIGSYAVTWVATGGDPDGFVRRADPSSYCYFFAAPAAQLGNLLPVSGGSIRFSLRSTHQSWAQDNVVILKGASGTVLVAAIALPATTWTRYRVTLVPSSFRVGSKTGVVPTQAVFDGVLGNVAGLWIPAEFGSAVQETSDLDSVVIDCTPWFSSQPAPSHACAGQTATMWVTADGPGPLTYRWWRDSAPLDPVLNPSAATPALMISGVQSADAGVYRCVVTGACGESVSDGAALTVGGVECGPAACNLADITGIGGPPSTPDGLLTGDDFNAFIAAFAIGDLLADITGIGGPPSSPDGLITGDDFNAFIAAFAAGCP